MCHILPSQHHDEPAAFVMGQEVPLLGTKIISVPRLTPSTFLVQINSFCVPPQTSQSCRGLSPESLPELPAKPGALSQLTPTSHGAPLKCLG